MAGEDQVKFPSIFVFFSEEIPQSELIILTFLITYGVSLAHLKAFGQRLSDKICLSRVLSRYL